MVTELTELSNKIEKENQTLPKIREALLMTILSSGNFKVATYTLN